jgi:hypothetical protein
MSCQCVATCQTFKEGILPRRRIEQTRRQIRRIEHAKTLVCGVVAANPLHELHKEFVALLSNLDGWLQSITSGCLDALDDDQLRSFLASLQSSDTGITSLIEGAERIGLEGCEPFPSLLAELRAKQERLQSSIEGILLSLDDSFQELVLKGTSEISKPA